MTSRRARAVTAAAGVVALAASAPASAAPPDGELVDDTVRRVLERPAFDGLEETLLEQLRERVIAFVVEQLGSIFGGATTSVVAYVLAGLALGLLVLVAVRVARRRVRVDGTTAATADVVVRRSPGAWLEDAADARRRGDLSAAARYGYRAVVATLDARGLVEDVDGRTVGEHRRSLAVAGGGRHLAAFDDAADVFERAWYGDEPVADVELDRVVDAARRVGAPDA